MAIFAPYDEGSDNAIAMGHNMISSYRVHTGHLSLSWTSCDQHVTAKKYSELSSLSPSSFASPLIAFFSLCLGTSRTRPSSLISCFLAPLGPHFSVMARCSCCLGHGARKCCHRQLAASGSSSEGERQPLLNKITSARSEGYMARITLMVIADEEAPLVPGEEADAMAEETVKTRLTYTIVCDVFLVLVIVRGLHCSWKHSLALLVSHASTLWALSVFRQLGRLIIWCLVYGLSSAWNLAGQSYRAIHF